MSHSSLFLTGGGPWGLLGLGQLLKKESMALATWGRCYRGRASRAISKSGPWDQNWDSRQAAGGWETGQVWSHVSDSVTARLSWACPTAPGLGTAVVQWTLSA